MLAPPPGRELVLTADAMVEGVHFLPDDPADLIARKLLRVNLSDLAAKGAAPLGYLLTVSARRGTPDAWFAGFAAGLAADQAEFGITLLGGDTTSTPGPLSLSLTCIGHVAPGAMVRRAGAQAGDGDLGHRHDRRRRAGPAGAAGRAARIPTAGSPSRYRLPQPRLGLLAPGLVAAAMDVSDGLVQDLGHLCRAAELGAELGAAQVPLSPAARAAGPAWLETCLTGGDDYELLLAVRPEQEAALHAAAQRGQSVSRSRRIGRFTDGQRICASWTLQAPQIDARQTRLEPLLEAALRRAMAPDCSPPLLPDAAVRCRAAAARRRRAELADVAQQLLQERRLAARRRRRARHDRRPAGCRPGSAA